MKYIVIEGQGVLTSQQRAEMISRELYRIVQPASLDSSNPNGMLVEVIKSETQDKYCLAIDPDQVLHVHPLVSLEKLIACFKDLTSSEVTDLQQYIYSSKVVVLSSILPSTAILRDDEEMIQLGWFSLPE